MPNKGHFRKYVDIPSAPTLTSPVTIIPSDNYAAGLYFYTLHGMTHNQGCDIIVDGNFLNGMSLNDFTATIGGPPPTPYRFVNAPGAIFGAAGGIPHAISTITDNDYLYFYGKSALEAPINKGQMGFSLGSRVGGSHHVVRNWVMSGTVASGVTCNIGSGTPGRYYSNIDLSFVRSFNSGQEGICYIGHTSNPYDYIDTCNINDCFSYNSIREGTQTEHINNLHIWNVTVNLGGQGGLASQDGIFQVYDSNGLIENCIFDGAPYFGVFCNHGLTLRNCYFRYVNNTYWQILRSDTQTWAATSTRLTGQPVLFDNCIFNVDSGTSLAKLVQILERNCDVEFRNCIFSTNIVSLWDDQRGASPPNSLIGLINTNGNTSQDIALPTYISGFNDPNDFLHHGLCTSSYFLSRRMGYRTPR